MEGIRIVEIPKMKMVSSGQGTIEELLARFESWLNMQPKDLSPRDFMWGDPKETEPN